MQHHSLLLDTGHVVDHAYGVGSACPKLIMKSNGKNKKSNNRTNFDQRTKKRFSSFSLCYRHRESRVSRYIINQIWSLGLIGAGKNRLPQVTLWPPHVHYVIHHPHTRMTNKYDKMSNNLGMFCLWGFYILYSRIWFFKNIQTAHVPWLSAWKRSRRDFSLFLLCVGVFLDSTGWSQTQCITQHGFEFMTLPSFGLRSPRITIMSYHGRLTFSNFNKEYQFKSCSMRHNTTTTPPPQLSRIHSQPHPLDLQLFSKYLSTFFLLTRDLIAVGNHCTSL